MQSTENIRRWHAMTSREQAIWAAAFSRELAGSGEAARAALAADWVVTQWRELQVDEEVERPETELARRNIAISRGEFDAWYPIAHRIAFGQAPSYRAPTAEECAEAYDRLERGRSDFY